MTTASAPACYYADKPDRRPTCGLTATATIGNVRLCPNCLTRRSTLGKGQRVRQLPAAHADDPDDRLNQIAAATARLRQAEQALTVAVHRARRDGCSWTQIGHRLNVTRQAAHQRFQEAPLP